MSYKRSIYFIQFGYYIGVFLGIFRFTYSTSEKCFKASKKLQIYNKFIFLASIGVMALLTLHFQQDKNLSFDNFVIKIAGVINIVSLYAIVLNAYLMFRKDQEIIEMLNFSLEMHENYKFGLFLFLRTFQMDGVSIFIMIISNAFLGQLSFNVRVLFNAAQLSKALTRYISHLYIFAIDFNMQILGNIESKIKKSITGFEDFLKNEPLFSHYQFTKEACNLSQELDSQAIKLGKLMKLMKQIHLQFSWHLLLIMAHNMSDILMLVRL